MSNTNIKNIHIYKRADINEIEIHFEFENGWNESKTLRLDDNRHIIKASLHALAEQIGRNENLDSPSKTHGLCKYCGDPIDGIGAHNIDGKGMCVPF